MLVQHQLSLLLPPVFSYHLAQDYWNARTACVAVDYFLGPNFSATSRDLRRKFYTKASGNAIVALWEKN